MAMTSVRLNDEVEAPLETLSKKLDRSKSYLINEAVREYIARQAVEDERWQDTQEALAAAERGEMVSEDAVHAWLDSWGTDTVLDSPEATSHSSGK
tara:strand:- start:228 stop:515 length:288 start_codon:yes stop_codon:yes gene_type:complete